MVKWNIFRGSSRMSNGLKIGWNFPLNEDGREEGLSNPGIETFRGKPLAFLSREICQNSLDARLEGNPGPVVVVFSLETIPADQFPGRDEFQAILEACLEFWKNRNPKTKNFFEAALKAFRQSDIPCLRISDYNTTGLLGASREGPSDWNNLIKAVGVSDKGPGKGGSYGIGKFAPFACSDLRTIFYSTFDCEGVRAFQGVADLVTHESPKKGGKKTTGYGFYGIESGNRPITEPSFIPRLFQRKEIGTDIIIVSFRYAQGWKREVVKSIISNFFLALHRNQLSVKVDDTIINKDTLSELLEEYFRDDSDARAPNYYACLVSEDAKFFSEEFNGLGRVALHVRQDVEGPKKVALFRNTGMMIKEKGHFRTTIRFAGVFEAQGEALNDKLRSLEPPGHDDWEPERCADPEDVDEARSLLKKLYSWINDCVKEVIQVEQSEQVDAVGIGQFLPDDLSQEEAEEPSEGPEETEKGSIEEIRVRPPGSEMPQLGEGQASPAGTGEDPTVEPGTTDNAGEGGKPGAGGTSGGEGEGEEGVSPGSGGRRSVHRKPLPLERARAYCIDSTNATYRLVIVPKESGLARIGVNYVGEEGWEAAKVLSARFVDSEEQVPVDSQGKIGPLPLEKGKRYAIVVNLSESLRCALGVVADAS